MEKTIKNLAKAFVGESQARNRYTMYAKIAKKEGYEEISANFALTADQEAEHAKWLMRMINELKHDNKELDEIQVEAGVPTILGTTEENLKAAMDGEHYEHESMYPEFAKVAEEEGLKKIAVRLEAIADAEKNHEYRYRVFLFNIKDGLVFKKNVKTLWQCRKCGYSNEAELAPEKCPSCGHPQAYFEQQY